MTNAAGFMNEEREREERDTEGEKMRETDIETPQFFILSETLSMGGVSSVPLVRSCCCCVHPDGFSPLFSPPTMPCAHVSCTYQTY